VNSAVQATADRSSAKDPSPALATALSSGDLEAATACFARDGCLLTADATTIRGREDIRAVLRQLISMSADVQVEQRALLVSGEIALAAEHWTTRFLAYSGATYARSRSTSTVLRRVEGIWKLQIAAPWGWG
jgi:uncharacterized protein (TIGR02246 family)